MKRVRKTPLIVVINIEPSQIKLGEQMRLSWRIANSSDTKVQITGYQLQFAKAGTPEPDWTKEEQRLISTPHVSMELWPEEIRTYEWSKVTPDYYGITSPGIWICYLRIAFTSSIRSELAFTKPTIGVVVIESSPLYISEAELLQLFTKNIEYIVTRYLKWDEMPRVRQELKMENRGVADLVFYTPSGKVAIVEIKKRITSRRSLSNALRQLSENVDWVSSNLAKSRETVWPILYVSDLPPKMDKMLSSEVIEKRGLKNLIVFSSNKNERIELRKSFSE
ncbi:MAG: hypothetical protein ACFFER_19470 [Candidatus Thorarchaeota archaeon]